MPPSILRHGRSLRLIFKDRSKRMDVHCILARAFNYVTDKRVLVKVKERTIFLRLGGQNIGFE
jgi:hypothetical protein